MLQTPLCSQIGIAYPIFSVGMGPVAGARTRGGGVECRWRWGTGWTVHATPCPPTDDPPAPHPDGQNRLG